MEKRLTLLFAILIFLLFGACSSVENVASQAQNWVNNSLEDIMRQTNDGISIPALGGFGAGAMIEARLNELDNDDTEEQATARLEEILDAIKNQDSDTIYNMFSINAKSNMKDFQEGVEYLFVLLEEDVESWERIGGSLSTSTNYGINKKTYNYLFYVNTNSHQYAFSIRECLVDDTDTNNIGLFSILARERINEDETYYFTDPGIYVPDQGSDDDLQ